MLISEAGVPEKTAKALAKKKIETIEDMVRFLPKRYRDYRTTVPLSRCENGAFCAVRGVLSSIDLKEYSLGKKLMTMRIQEPSSGTLLRATFFSRHYLFTSIFSMRGREVIVCGRIVIDETYGIQMTEPEEVCLAEDFTFGIRPVYGKIKGVSEQALVSAIDTCIAWTKEPFEWEVINKTSLLDYASALRLSHHPQTESDIRNGLDRLLFNDLFYLAYGLESAKKELPAESKILLKSCERLKSFVSDLPFPLTQDQRTAIRSMYERASTGTRINTLIQGDVGSGKTVVAMSMMLLAAENGYQSVLMAPREVLAYQHFREFLGRLGMEDDTVYLSSGMKAREKKEALLKIKNGKARFIIGTHSLISQGVEYKNLGLIVTDEEHLFGVAQKDALAKKAASGVHIISLSATPIPRTLASVLYGEGKEISQIRTMPDGRKPIKTAIVPNRDMVIKFIKQQAQDGNQCFIVCPAIEENEDYDIVNIDEVVSAYAPQLEEGGIGYAVVHGRLGKEKMQGEIERFERGEAKVLIATTVVEVGINVPRATTIVIEQAERFGLSSLHQLRGRVGRSRLQGYCILRSEDKENERLKALLSTTDGFKIAEEDLRLRGTGNLLGIEQSGMNKYIELMLSYPGAFGRAKELAIFCVKWGFGGNFPLLYERPMHEGRTR